MSAHDRLAGVVELSTWIESQGGARSAGPLNAVDGPASRVDEARGDAAFIDEHEARSIALRLLGRKGSSRAELRQMLTKRGVEEHVVAPVLDGLERERLIDDVEFARDLAERLRERKRKGERGVAAELRRRGLDPSALDSVDPDDEAARAVEAATERRRRSSSHDDEAAERRLTGYLQRRGFSGAAVRHAIEQTRPRSPRFR